MKSLNIRGFCRRYWQPLSLYGLLLMTIVLVLSIQLNSLLPAFTGSEVQAYRDSLSLRYIFHHPLNAPYSLLAWAVIKSHVHHPLLYLRAISASLAFCTLAAFSGLLYYWHGSRVALFGTLLFGTSSWFLHIARLGTPDILMFGLFVLVACGVWLQATKSPFAIIALLLLSAGLLYVPGMAWLIALSVIINWKRLDDIFSDQLWIVTLGTVLAIAMVLPLGWDIYRSPELAKSLLNLPGSGWLMPFTVLKNIAKVPLHIFIYGPGKPVTELGHLPVLSAFGSAMFILGGALYLRHFGLQRVKLFVAFLIVCTVVVSLGSLATLSLLVPFLYLVAAAGTGYLLDQWFAVFPRNPIARGIGVVALLAVVLLVMGYNLRQYFISWPNAPATKAVFQQQDIGTPKTFDTIIR